MHPENFQLDYQSLFTKYAWYLVSFTRQLVVKGYSYLVRQKKKKRTKLAKKSSDCRSDVAVYFAELASVLLDMFYMLIYFGYYFHMLIYCGYYFYMLIYFGYYFSMLIYFGYYFCMLIYCG